jgi:hypothetical protein
LRNPHKKDFVGLAKSRAPAFDGGYKCKYHTAQYLAQESRGAFDRRFAMALISATPQDGKEH